MQTKNYAVAAIEAASGRELSDEDLCGIKLVQDKAEVNIKRFGRLNKKV